MLDVRPLSSLLSALRRIRRASQGDLTRRARRWSPGDEGERRLSCLFCAPASSCSAACAPPPTRPQNHADVYSTHAARSPARELSCPGARVQTRDELEPTNRTAGSPVVSKPLPSSRFSVCSKLTGFQTVEFEGGGGPRHRSLVPLARGYDSRRTSGPFVVCVGMKGCVHDQCRRAKVCYSAG